MRRVKVVRELVIVVGGVILALGAHQTGAPIFVVLLIVGLSAWPLVRDMLNDD